MNTEIIKLLYYMLPAFVSNMTPIFLNHLPMKKVPMDFGLKLGNKQIFGPNKSWNGLIGGIILGTLTAFVQSRFITGLELFDYGSWLLMGFLLSSGALVGDAVKSFVKRRINIPSGKPWIPFDQIDYAVGAIAFGSIVYFPGWLNSLMIVAASFLLHIVITKIGYHTRLRPEKW